MKKEHSKRIRKLVINRDTIRRLTKPEIEVVQGAVSEGLNCPCTYTSSPGPTQPTNCS
ncbi:hypothetical protein [Haliangium sp.]|uniref:hypothetical protein n=1 Tax=Haliangium sp. TaxID=2663208 RepID=UPI003D0E2155